MKNHATFKKLVIERSKASISSTNRRTMSFSVASITEFNKAFKLEDEEKEFFLKGWEDASQDSDDPHIKSIVAFGCKALKERRSLNELGYMGPRN